MAASSTSGPESSESGPLDLDPVSQSIIAWKARQLIRRLGWKPQDREDLEQHLCCHVWQRLAAFDPSRGNIRTYVATVVNRAALNWVRDRLASCRDGRRIRAIKEDHPDTSRDPKEITDCAIDVNAALTKVPPNLRHFAERLQSETLSQAARDLGVPRSTAQNWARQLRQRFAQAGLQKYVQNVPSFSDRTG